MWAVFFIDCCLLPPREFSRREENGGCDVRSTVSTVSAQVSLLKELKMSLRMKNNKREGRLSSTTRKITTMIMTAVAVMMMMRQGLNMRHAQLEYDNVVDKNDDDERRIGY